VSKYIKVQRLITYLTLKRTTNIKFFDFVLNVVS